MKRVLLLDDDELVLSALGRYLSLQGFLVVEARHREEAEALLGREPIDLAILDIALTPGGREGLDLLRTIRTLQPGLPVIVFSGLDRAEVEGEAKRLGANSVVTKPQFSELARAVHGLLARKP